MWKGYAESKMEIEGTEKVQAAIPFPKAFKCTETETEKDSDSVKDGSMRDKKVNLNEPEAKKMRLNDSDYSHCYYTVITLTLFMGQGLRKCLFHSPQNIHKGSGKKAVSSEIEEFIDLANGWEKRKPGMKTEILCIDSVNARKKKEISLKE